MASEDLHLYDWQAEQDFPPSETYSGTSDWGADHIFEDPVAEPVTPPSSEPPGRQTYEYSIAIDRATIRLMATCLVASLLAGVALKQIEGGSQQKTVASSVPCFPPTPRAVERVTELFGNDKSGAQGTIYAAQEAGVHLTYIDDFNAPYGQPGTTEDTTTDPQASLNWASEDLKQFGITLKLGVPGGKDDGLFNPSRAELDQNVNHALYEITDSLTFLPVELVRATNINKIILMANPKSNIDYTFDGYRTLVWNIDFPPYAEEMSTALYGAIDYTECAFNGPVDSNYARLNGTNIYGPADRAGLLSLDQFGQQDAFEPSYTDVETSLLNSNKEVMAAYQRGSRTGNYERYCYLVSRTLHNIVVPTSDSFDSANDDKEDLGGRLLDIRGDNYRHLLSPQSPVLRRKSLFLLGRLYDLNPRIVKYLAAATDHTEFNGVNCP